MVQGPERRGLGKHLRYILGEKAAGFNVNTKAGERAPPWETVLTYELTTRKDAIPCAIYEEMSLAQAMEEARKCTELREQHVDAGIGHGARTDRDPAGDGGAMEHLADGVDPIDERFFGPPQVSGLDVGEEQEDMAVVDEGGCEGRLEGVRSEGGPGNVFASKV